MLGGQGIRPTALQPRLGSSRVSGLYLGCSSPQLSLEVEWHLTAVGAPKAVRNAEEQFPKGRGTQTLVPEMWEREAG